MPVPNTNEHRTLFFNNQKGEPNKRGGRRNVSGPNLLDRIIFDRISMLTDPALDAGRHEFNVTTTLGRLLSPEDFLQARTAFETAIARDPVSPRPHAWLAKWHVMRVAVGASKDAPRDAIEATASAERAWTPWSPPGPGTTSMRPKDA